MKLSNTKCMLIKFTCLNIWLKLIFLLTLFVLSSSSIFAQIEPDSLVEFSKAPVTLDGSILFYVRGISSYPAKERAQSISKRLEDIAEDYSIQVNSIKIVQSEIQDEIFASDKLIMRVYDADAKIDGVRREVLSEAINRNITKAIYAYRYERSSEALLNKTFYAIGATVITLLLLFLINWLVKKAHLLIETKLKTKRNLLRHDHIN